MRRTATWGLTVALIGTAGFGAAAQEASDESKALNHARFVEGATASCLEACAVGGRPFTGRETTPAFCEESCACIGEQLGARVSGDDLWQMYLAERAGASRAEAMAPYVPTISMGYAACGFPVE